jgi:hypothetical protein
VTGEGRERALAAAWALWAALAAPLPAAAQPASTATQGATIEAILDRDEIGVDERVVLTVRVESSEAPSGIEFPKDLPFSVVSRGQSTGSNISLGGGAGVQIRRTLLMTFELAPRTTGELRIPPITAVVGGRRISTEPLTLRVLKAGSRPSPPPNSPPGPGGLPGFGGPGGPPATGRQGGSWRGWERDLRLWVELDKAEVYLGEQVAAAVWIVSPVEVLDALGYKEPTFDGFWKEQTELPDRLKDTIRRVDGVPYRFYLLQRLALFPTRAGKLEVKPFEVAVRVRAGNGSPFDPFPEVRTARRKSQPLAVTVKPLPPGAPAGFESVNVGRLELSASLSDGAVAAGQPVTVRLTAQGDANVRTLSLPRVPPLDGARRFDPSTADKLAVRAGRMGGSRTVETVLVPEREGELVVPALTWPVFDPGKGAYRTLRTPELRVRVGSADASAVAPAAGTHALTAGLRPIRSDPALRPAGPPPWRSPAFLSLLAVPALGYAGLALALRLRERSSASAGLRRHRGAGRAARRRLAQARRHLARGERQPFLAEVERALHGYAADRLGQPVGSLTREALSGALSRAGAHGPSVRALQEALAACDAARYGRGGAPDEDQALLQSAERTLTLLDQADWSEGAGRAA